MRLLVTGGTGFIGSHLAADARRRGAEVTVLGLTDLAEERENARWLAALGVEVVSGSLTDATLCRRSMQGMTHVHHLAVAMREAGVPDSHFERVNLEGTRQLLRVAAEERIERFVYCSTIGIFGHRAPGITHEDSPLAPGNIYERTKVGAERLVLDTHRETGLPVVVLRPADVYGPRDRRLLKLFRGVDRGRFPLFGDGRGRRHMVYVDDVTSAFALACERREALGQTMIIAGPEVCTLRDLIAMITEACGRRRFGVRLPLPPALAAAAVVEDVCTAFKIPPPIYRRRMDFYTSDSAFDTTRARAVLAWAPSVGLREGIQRTFEWYREAGLLG